MANSYTINTLAMGKHTPMTPSLTPVGMAIIPSKSQQSWEGGGKHSGGRLLRCSCSESSVELLQKRNPQPTHSTTTAGGSYTHQRLPHPRLQLHCLPQSKHGTNLDTNQQQIKMEMDAYRTVLFLCKENKTVRCRKMDEMEIIVLRK